MDLQTLFYTLGVIFFVLLSIFFIVATVVIIMLYQKAKNLQLTAEKKVEHIMGMVNSNKMALFPIAATAMSFIAGIIKKKMQKD